MSFNQVFADYYQKLCLIVNEQPGVMQAKTMMEYLLEEIGDEELILKGIKAASQIKNKKVRVYTDKQGHISEVPRLPTAVEIAEICNDLKEDYYRDKEQQNAMRLLSEPKEITKQAAANGQLACSLVAWFKCCPDKVYSLINSGALVANKLLAEQNMFEAMGTKNIYAKKRQEQMKQYIQTHYESIIELCKKEEPIRS
tara:strand:+ start:1099 stop:1692 length:594 start_codon:yes stop_codon:yes gene_type:complete